MAIFAVIGLAMVAAVICLLLRQYRPEYALLVSLGCGIVLFGWILSGLSPAFAALSSLMEKAAVSGKYVQAMIKTLGICYVTQLAADACRDAGQTAIAGKVELAGRVCIVLLSLPLFEDLVELAFSLIQGGGGL